VGTVQLETTPGPGSKPTSTSTCCVPFSAIRHLHERALRVPPAKAAWPTPAAAAARVCSP